MSKWNWITSITAALEVAARGRLRISQSSQRQADPEPGRHRAPAAHCHLQFSVPKHTSHSLQVPGLRKRGPACDGVPRKKYRMTRNRFYDLPVCEEKHKTLLGAIKLKVNGKTKPYSWTGMPTLPQIQVNPIKIPIGFCRQMGKSF